MDDISGFVKEPARLVELCRCVIEELSASTGDSESGEQEAQLREISKTIDRLENAQITVPDVLRAEKTRLVAHLALKSDRAKALSELASGLSDLVRVIRRHVVQPAFSSPSAAKKKDRPSPDRISRKLLRDELVSYLRMCGGKASAEEVFSEIARRLEDQFLPGDLKWFDRNKWKGYAWQAALFEEARELKNAGIMRNDTLRGAWELKE